MNDFPPFTSHHRFLTLSVSAWMFRQLSRQISPSIDLPDASHAFLARIPQPHLIDFTLSGRVQTRGKGCVGVGPDVGAGLPASLALRVLPSNRPFCLRRGSRSQFPSKSASHGFPFRPSRLRRATVSLLSVGLCCCVKETFRLFNSSKVHTWSIDFESFLESSFNRILPSAESSSWSCDANVD